MNFHPVSGMVVLVGSVRNSVRVFMDMSVRVHGHADTFLPSQAPFMQNFNNFIACFWGQRLPKSLSIRPENRSRAILPHWVAK